MSTPINPLSADLSVAPQLSASDMESVSKAGYKSVIINRPDYEGGPEQPASADVIAEGQKQGLTMVYQPVVGSAITADDVQTFHDLMNSLPKPILAYCRSGTRCSILFQASQQLDS